jgi:hypothetical protein
MMARLEAPVPPPAAWRGEDLQHSDEWVVLLGEDELSELERALRQVADIPAEHIEALPDLPLLREQSHDWLGELEEGRGFLLLRGLPVHERFDEDEAAKVFFMLGSLLGTPVSQNRSGELIGHLRATATPGAFERRYSTNEATAFHSDRTDVVGLMCLRPALVGGESLLASTLEAHNVVLSEHPEYLPVLYKEFPKDLMGDAEPGAPGWELLPLFCYVDGYLSGTTSTAWFISAMRFPDVPRLNAEEISCFLFLDSVPKRPGMALSMGFQTGDIQFANNYVVTHTRTSFVDDPDDPTHQRHLLRLWVSRFEGGRPVCDAFARARSGIAPRLASNAV